MSTVEQASISATSRGTVLNDIETGIRWTLFCPRKKVLVMLVDMSS